MRKPIIWLYFLSLGIFFSACHRGLYLEKEEEASGGPDPAPYDRFAEQRAWPDTIFDWKSWRRQIQQLKAEAAVQERNPDPCAGNTTPWTLQGPGNVGGRVNTLATQPGNDLVVLAGFAGGGIFKSTNGGIDWYPVFDDFPDLAIGDIRFDPNQPNVVYAGTGDPNMPSIVFNGDGIYKSTDAGEHWTYLGLGDAGIISKIILHPTQSQTLFVATMGNPYVRDNQRGVYKSTDGGQTWQQVLFVSNQAGASDLVIDPQNPDILYAAFWDRIRAAYESIVYGPNARIYKTTNGGQSWTQLGGGLPTGVMGRVGLAISQQNPQKLFAIYVDTLHTVGALYKTTNGGNTWALQNSAQIESAFSDFGWYFGKLRLNPNDDEDLYLLGVLLWRRPANGGWQPGAGGHADSHAFVHTPSGRRYWGNDGGVYFSAPGQNTWTHCLNTPTTQIYHTDFNPHLPDTYFIGCQDNGVQRGNGAAYNNWVDVFFADGFNCAFDPADPNLYWVETQNGTIHKTNNGGDSWIQGTPALGTSDRVNWDMPFFMSTHEAPKRFAGTYRAYEASGDTWTPISPDLTDGVLTQPRFHTISAMNESPVQSGKLFVGTSDANIWRREPNGVWANISNGLPDRYVTSVHGSTQSANRIFVTHSGFRYNEKIPHVHRSDDNGLTWTDISADLPNIPVNDLLIMPGLQDQVLFVATDGGVYFTRNAGQKWQRLGSGMPMVPVFDLEINPVRGELLAATFGRGLYTFPLDSVLSQGSGGVSISLAGAVNTETQEGVSGVRVQQTPFVETDHAGLFDIPEVNGCQEYLLKPEKNDHHLNGVSTFDLLLMSKHILGIEALGSPYQLIAADANRSGSITNFDILTTRKLILGIDTVFPGNTSWRFVPADAVFPNPANPFASVFPEAITVPASTVPLSGFLFTGIKIGDVNHSVIPNAQSSTEERLAGLLPLLVREKTENGRLVTEISTGAAAAALQFSVQTTRILEVIPLAPGLDKSHFNLQHLSEGRLSMAWESPEGIPEGQVLFRLVVAAQPGAYQLTETPTRALAYTQEGQVLAPWLQTQEAAARVQVFPNPCQAQVFVALPEQTPADSWQLLDANGREVLRTTVRTGVEMQSVEQLPAGSYQWRLLAREVVLQSGQLVKSK